MLFQQAVLQELLMRVSHRSFVACPITVAAACSAGCAIACQVDEPAAAAGPTPAAPSKPAAPSRDAAMLDGELDDDLQKALALSMQVRTLVSLHLLLCGASAHRSSWSGLAAACLAPAYLKRA